VNFDRTIALIEISTLLRLLFYYQAAHWLFLINKKRDLTFSFEVFLYSHWYCKVTVLEWNMRKLTLIIAKIFIFRFARGFELSMRQIQCWKRKKVSCENVKSCYFIYKNTERRTKVLEKIVHVNSSPFTVPKRTPYISTVLNPRRK
jgi:hypothetical protein